MRNYAFEVLRIVQISIQKVLRVVHNSGYKVLRIVQGGTMFKRKAYEKLLAWKTRSNGKTALLVEGARRVGKSTLVRELGANEYRSCLVIDFFQAPDEVKQYFRDYSNNLDTLFLYLSVYYSVELYERESLVIFDEVQMFPFARGMLKYLVEDGRFDYIETGSLLSIKQNIDGIVIPSEEETLELAPFDFEEFLWAMKEAPLAQLIGTSFNELKPLPDALHRRAYALFREYMLVGGMPQSVTAYVEERKFEPVNRVKNQIIDLYRNDVARFARGYEFKVVSVLDGIPGQLSKLEKKYPLSSISTTARMRTYEEAFFWLADARIANVCYASSDPSVGLGLSMDQTSLKCYMADTGLLVTLALSLGAVDEETVYRSVLRGEVGLNEGMLTENVVAQELRAHGHRLFFYSQSGKKTGQERMEIDFVIVRPYANAAGKPRVSPVEVKSPRQYGTSSLDKFSSAFGKHIGTQFVLHPKQLKADGDRMYLPLYMAGWL